MASQELNDWNPMKEDYEDVEFNSYDRGPGRNLPKDIREHHNVTTLVIKGVPADLNQNGLRNIFHKYGEVKKVNIWSGNNEYTTNMGFVTMGSTVECMHAMKGENGRNFGPHKLIIALSRNRDQDNRRNVSRANDFKGPQTLPSPPTRSLGSMSSASTTLASRNSGSGFGEVGAGFGPQASSGPGTSPSVRKSDSSQQALMFSGRAATSLPDAFAEYNPTKLHGGLKYVKANIDIDSLGGPDDMWAIAILDFVTEKFLSHEKKLAEYTKIHAKRLVQVSQAQVGDLVLSKFEGEWRRGIVQEVLPSGACSIRHVDFGSADQVDNSALRRLPIELTDIPALACPITLAGLTLSSQTNQETVRQALKVIMQYH